MLPLHHRVPNPPPTFHGRETEKQWIAEAIRRAPVCVVWGPGGIGKSALVNSVLHLRGCDPQHPMMRVHLRRDSSDVELQVIGAIASTNADVPVRWSALAGEPTSMLIEMAEAGGWLILVDDLHRAAAPDVKRLLVQLSRYARDSRWIFTSRREPVLPELSTQILELGPMSREALAGLARDCAPSAGCDLIESAVSISEGSPWRLQQYLAGGEMALQTIDQMLAGLSEVALQFVRALLVSERPLPLRALAQIAPAPTEEELEAMARRGLLERSLDSVRLHDVARATLSASHSPNPETLRKAAIATSRDRDPVVALEGIELCAQRGLWAELDAALERHGDKLLAHHAPLLSTLLQGADGSNMIWRLRCALAMGDVTALNSLGEPVGPGVEESLLWAEAHLVRGDLERAAEVAAETRRRPTASRGQCFDAGLIESRATMNRAQFAEALEVLESLDPALAEQAVQRDAYAAVCHTAIGDGQTALAALSSVREQLHFVPELVEHEVQYRIAQSYYHLGHLNEAASAIAAHLDGPSSPALFNSRFALLLGATIALERGLLDDERSLMARLEPFVSSDSLLRSFVDDRNLSYRFAAGQFAGLDQAVDQALASALRRGDGNMFHSARALREHYRLLMGAAPELDANGSKGPQAPAVMARLVELFRSRRLVRAGQLETPPQASASEHPELELIYRTAVAEHQFLAGDRAAAIAAARSAISFAGSYGYAVREAEVRHLLCEFLLVAGDRGGLAIEAQTLIEQGGRMSSERFALEGRFFRLFSQPRLELATIEHTAARADAAPVGARRAQALLAASPNLDRFDRAVVAAFKSHPDWRTVRRVTSGGENAGEWLAGWGIDERQKRAWFADGGSVELGHSPILWRLLSALVELGGASCKETLVRAVWNESEYHPLKHDNRLHAAIRKLRRALEVDPSNPARVQTSDDGYHLGGTVRMCGTMRHEAT